MQDTPPAIRIGFMPLTDCASLVMAVERGFDKQYGVNIVLSRETSWASLRDKLGSGALDAAHALYGMVYGVQMGIGCVQQDMAVLMNLSQNGQAITLSRALAERGTVGGAGLAATMRAGPRAYTFAQTFPTGNHAMLLYYWLAAYGVDPFRDVRTVTVPPTQMVPSLREEMIDGFCAGEPWGQRAVQDGIGVTAATSQQIWPDHPGKVLGTRAAYAEENPQACRALIAAVLDAAKWIDACDANKLEAAKVLAGPAYLNTSADTIAPRLLGQYQNGLGETWNDANALAFHRGGAVNFPYLSDGMWFMTQQRRWGLVRHDPDYLAVACRVNQVELFREAAQMTGTEVPTALLRSSRLIDGTVWDGGDPAGYAGSFRIHNM
jgi:ABC-type nitrate/sulfonate/bicarbonate transport system substrate-binding protein